MCAHCTAMINGLRNGGTCSMWHKLLSLCVIPFLFLTATRVSLSHYQPQCCWIVGEGAGGCDMSWQHSNNPCKLTGWGVNANAKSTIEKWLKSISVFYLTVLLMLGNKGFQKKQTWVSGTHASAHFNMSLYPPWEDLNLIVFQAAFYLPHCHNHSPSNRATS